MIRGGVALGALVLALAAACGGEESDAEKEAAGNACGPAPGAMSGSPKLPQGFPMPDGVMYTSERKAGPSTIVEGFGFREGEIEEAFDGYKEAFDSAGYDVTKDEREEVDAEVNFAGGGTDGQVKLIQECADRTSVSITIRPA